VPGAGGLPLAECEQACSPPMKFVCQGGQCVNSSRGVPKAECAQICAAPGPPPPPPSPCKSALQTLCGGKRSNPVDCGRCSGQHALKLRLAGCGSKAIDAWCSGASPGPPPASPFPGSRLLTPADGAQLNAWSRQGHIRLSLCSTAQPLYTRFPIKFSTCFSNVTTGYYPRSRQAVGQEWRACYSSFTMDKKSPASFHDACDKYKPTAFARETQIVGPGSQLSPLGLFLRTSLCSSIPFTLRVLIAFLPA
jgi:hypothetical protein